MSLLADAGVLGNREVAPGYFRLALYAPEIAGVAVPGQFVHVRCGPLLDPLLRRPLSIHDVDRQSGRLYLLYRLTGRGTALLAGNKAGATVNLMGPLGHGFTLPIPPADALVVGGGIGIAPLFYLVKELADAGNQIMFLGGFRTAREIVAVKEMENLGVEVALATDDGSLGYQGPVTELLEKYIAGRAYSFCYACGPRPMLQKVAEIITLAGVPGEVSLEERMGCGVGACLACACKTRSREGDGFCYSHVCIDGPVFSAGEVVW
jgi:dihydroorotate dehydrogenase electron transfer subunit